MASMTFTVDDDSTGNRVPLVQITITENLNGTLSFDVVQLTSPGAYLGDLRGIFFDIAREALIGSLFVTNVTGGPLTELRQEADGVRDLGNGANMQGLFGTGNTASDPNNNQGYDVGIEIGTQGVANDVREFHFTLGSGAGPLSIADLTNRDVGVRLTSVGRDTNGDGTIDTSRGYQARIVENAFLAIDATDDPVGTVEEDTVASGNLLANDSGAGTKELTGVEYEGVSYAFSGTDPILIALTDIGGNPIGATVTIHRDGSYEVDALDADLLSEGQSIGFDIAYHARNTVLEANGSLAGSGTDTAHFVGAVAGVNDAPEIEAGSFGGTVVAGTVFGGLGEFLVNTGGGNQAIASVTSLLGGGWVAAWQRLISDGYDVIGQMFGADGQKSGPEFILNTTTAGFQELTSISALSTGGFVAVWQRSSFYYDGDAVWAQAFDSAGSRVGPEILVATPTVTEPDGRTLGPTVAGLADGRFVVAWEDYDPVTGGVRCQIFNSDGSPFGATFVAGTPQPDQYRPKIATMPDGRFAVVWEDDSQTGPDTSGLAVRVQIYTSDGIPVDAPILVNTTTEANQMDPAIASFGDGRFIVAWNDYSQTGGDSSDSAIRAQLFDPAGNPIGSEFLVNSTTPSGQTGPDISVMPDGSFVIVWTDNSETGGDTSLGAIRGQRFDPDGNRLGSEFLVNANTSGGQVGPAITVSGDGRFVVTWQTEGAQIAAQEFGPVQSAVATASGTFSFLDADLLDTHGVTVTPVAVGYRGALNAAVTNDSIGDGAGEIDWNFSVDQSALADLAAGQTLTQTYSVRIDDGRGGSAHQDIVITLEGANDVPAITAGDFSGAVVTFVPLAEIDLSDLDGSNGFSVSGFESGEHARNMVAGGDINGDGYADMIVGANVADISGSDSGAAYVVFGKSSGFASDVDVSSLDGDDGFRLVGVAAGDGAGGSLAFLGDVNGDGFGDFALGAHGASPGGPWSGSTYVVFGKAGGFDPSIDLANLSGSDGFRIDGDIVDGTRGSIWVSSAGDINGDGLNEIIIGTPQGHGSPGAAYVVFGRDTGFSAAMSVASLDGANGFKINGQGSQRAAWSVSSAGDFNDDGYGDIIVGANEAAAAWVVFGHDEGFSAQMNLADLNGADGFRLNGIAVPPGSTEFEGADIDGTGVSVSHAGDINGDSIDDVVIGAHGGPFGTWPGAAYVVFGTTSPFAANFSLSSLDGDNGFKLVGNRGTGGSTSAAGDFNGDGYDDLIVGNPHAVSGASYVVFGRSGGFAASMDLLSLNGTDGVTLPGLATGDRSGTVSSADVNGDGLGDLLIAAKGNETNGSDTAYVVFGQSLGTSVLTDSGSFSFADVDLADSHTVSVTPAGGGYRGSLTAVVADDSTGDGFGSIGWSFAVDQSALADLTPGQSLTQTYSVAVNDGNGGIDQRDVTVTLSAELLFA